MGDLDEGDPFDGLGVATRPRDLTTMDAVGPVDAPWWSCPVCGMVRVPA
jgi:hypothetical protein